MLGESELPPIHEYPISEMRNPVHYATICQIRGVVQKTEVLANGRKSFWLRDGRNVIQCFIRAGIPVGTDISTLLDAEVKLTGVCQPASSKIDSDTPPTVFVIHDFRDLTITQPAPPDPLAARIRLIRDLDHETRHAVHIRAKVISEPRGTPKSFLVQDSSGSILVSANDECWVRLHEEIDLVGFPHRLGVRREFNAIRVDLRQPERGSSQSNDIRYLPTLFEPAKVLSMTPAEAGKGYPVRMRGIVTYSNPHLKDLFVQDDQCAIYVSKCPQNVPINTVVEIEGFTDPGGFKPMLIASAVREMGDAKTIEPAPVAPFDLYTGRLDCQLVYVEGVVHEVKMWEPHCVLLLLTDLGFVEVCTADGSLEEARRRIDSKIRVTGAYSAISHPISRRLSGFRIFTSHLNRIETLVKSPPNPFELPLRKLSQLLADRRETHHHRVRLEGTILGRTTGGSYLLQDEPGVIRVQVLEEVVLARGDRVEMVGFLSPNLAVPELRGAAVRLLGHTPVEPEPLIVTQSNLREKDGHLVRLRVRFLNRFARETVEVLSVQSGSTFFEVVLSPNFREGSFEDLEPGTTLEVEGICIVNGSSDEKISTFQIECSEPGQIRLVEKPSWWTPRRTLAFAAGAIAILSLTLCWVTVLRIQVRR
jgi:uncharacterized protein YdeI (BOF family)